MCNIKKILFLIVIFQFINCSTHKIEKNSSNYLIRISDNESPNEFIANLYIYPISNMSKNSIKIKNTEYGYKILYFSRDGFNLVSCCKFYETRNLY